MRSCFGRSPYRWETAIAEPNLELLQAMVQRVLDGGISGVAGNRTAASFCRRKAPSRGGRSRPARPGAPPNTDPNSPHNECLKACRMRLKICAVACRPVPQ